MDTYQTASKFARSASDCTPNNNWPCCGGQIQEYARVRAREFKVSRGPNRYAYSFDVDARPTRNSRDCSYAVTQFGIVS